MTFQNFTSLPRICSLIRVSANKRIMLNFLYTVIWVMRCFEGKQKKATAKKWIINP